MEFTKETIRENEKMLNTAVSFVYRKYGVLLKRYGIDKKELKHEAIVALYLKLRKDEKAAKGLLYYAILYDLLDYIRTVSQHRATYKFKKNIDDYVIPASNKNPDAWIDIEYIKEHYAKSLREKQVIELLAVGYKPGEVAKILGVTPNAIWQKFDAVRKRCIGHRPVKKTYKK